MKEELEAQIPYINPEEMVRRIQLLDGTLIYNGPLPTLSLDFDPPHALPLYVLRANGKEGRVAFADSRGGRFREVTVNDYDEFERMLDRLGFERRNEARFAPKRIKSISDFDGRLRLRHKTDPAHHIELGELTLKVERRFVNSIKHAKEYEVAIDRHDLILEMLAAFGMRQFKKYTKRRAEYALHEGISVAIDCRDGLDYLEVEASTESLIIKTVKQLGLAMSDVRDIKSGKVYEIGKG